MTIPDNDTSPAAKLLDAPNLSDVLESDRFKQFLDNVPFAVAVAELQPSERITYVNLEFERLTGLMAAGVRDLALTDLDLEATAKSDGRPLTEAASSEEDYLGTFAIQRDGGETDIDVWSNIIEDDNGAPTFRLVAFAALGGRTQSAGEDLHARIASQDVLLRELQHRVKNNLQMITALIRMEVRNLPEGASGTSFQRLEGRIGSLALLYNSMNGDEVSDTIDLGVYLSQIASAVMAAHAVEGIRLDMKVDTWPVSLNVAMPTGLVVNELLTNALKYAFEGREGGTIRLHSLVDASGCRVVVGDDGVGLKSAGDWPRRGKLSALIVQSLKQNARATVDVQSAPGEGMTVSIFFARANAT